MSSARISMTPDSSSPARAEASLWIVRLHGPQRSPALEAGFREWLAADAENAREFEHVTEVWDSALGLSKASLPRMGRWEAPPQLRSFARAAIAASICAAVAVGSYWLWREPLPTYTTALGEQRMVRMEDGTRISLNSDTLIEIVYNDSERQVRLKGGEAFFEVARDPARLFVVIAGERQVTALGTAFVVRYEPQRTAISLVEGKVSVAARDRLARPSSPRAQMLAPGERLIFAARRPAQIDTPRMDVVTAWRRGEVILDKTTLAEAAAEMNRYDKTALVIDDPALGALRISGVYKTGDSRSFAQAAARMLGLEAAERDGRIHLQR